MLQINVDPSGLSKPQREALAGFILAYPGGRITNANSDVEITIDSKQVAHSIADAVQSAIAPEVTPGNISPPVQSVPSPLAQTVPGQVAPTGSGAVQQGPVLDVDGIPWDARIHSSGKTMNKDGTWARKRNIDDALFESVKLELKKLMAIQPPTGSVAPPVDTVTTLNPGAVFSVDPAAVSAPVIPPPPTTNVQVPPSQPGNAPVDPNAFVQLIGATSGLIAQGKLSQQELDAFCLQQGVPSVALLANRPDLVPAVHNAVNALVATR